MNQNFRRRETCPICGGSETNLLVEVPFAEERLWTFLHDYYKGRIEKSMLEGADYRLAKCGGCGHVYQEDILVDEMLQELYEVWISPEESLAKIQSAPVDRFDLHASQVSNISRILEKKPGEVRVLEFGMGWGYWLLMAKAYGYQAFGAELSRPRIDFAHQNGLAVIEDLVAEEEPFDYIFSNQCFEHVAEPFEMMELLTSNLSANGVIHICVPQGKKVRQGLSQSSWKPAKDAVHPLEHINCFTRDDLRTLGKRSGLEEIAMPRYAMAPGLKGIARSFMLHAYNRTINTDILLRRAS